MSADPALGAHEAESDRSEERLGLVYYRLWTDISLAKATRDCIGVEFEHPRETRWPLCSNDPKPGEV